MSGPVPGVFQCLVLGTLQPLKWEVVTAVPSLRARGQAQCPHYCTHFTDEETEAAGLEGLSDLLGSEWWLSRVGGKEQAGRGSRAPDLQLTRAPAPVLGGGCGPASRWCRGRGVQGPAPSTEHSVLQVLTSPTPSAC